MPPSPETEIALLRQGMDRMEKDIADIKGDIRQIKADNEREFITKPEFRGHEDRLSRLEKVVFTAMSVILLGFLSAVVTFFIRNPRP